MSTMPEWVTHLLLGLIAAEVFSVRKKSVVLLGAILPDLLVKLVLVKLFLPIPNIDYSLLGAFHVPFVFLLSTFLLATWFRYSYWHIVLWLNLGALTHFLSDALLRHLAGGGVRLLYPLSLEYYTLGGVWPEQSYLIFIPALLLYGLIKLTKRWHSSKMSDGWPAASPNARRTFAASPPAHREHLDSSVSSSHHSAALQAQPALTKLTVPGFSAALPQSLKAGYTSPPVLPDTVHQL